MAAGNRPLVFSTVDERFCTSLRLSGTKATLTAGVRDVVDLLPALGVGRRTG